MQRQLTPKEVIDNLINGLDLFLKKPYNNEWVDGGDGNEIYFRKGFIHPSIDSNYWIDVSTVSLHPDYWHKGIFKAFLTHLEGQSMNIWVENVGPEFFRQFLERRGYTKHMTDVAGLGDPCYYIISYGVEHAQRA